jgi:hypothetical protein
MWWFDPHLDLMVRRRVSAVSNHVPRSYSSRRRSSG